MSSTHHFFPSLERDVLNKTCLNEFINETIWHCATNLLLPCRYNPIIFCFLFLLWRSMLWHFLGIFALSKPTLMLLWSTSPIWVFQYPFLLPLGGFAWHLVPLSCAPNHLWIWCPSLALMWFSLQSHMHLVWWFPLPSHDDFVLMLSCLYTGSCTCCLVCAQDHVYVDFIKWYRVDF